MRVIQLVQQPALGGAEVFAAQLRSALHGRGHAVRMLYLYSCADEASLPLESEDILLNGNRRSWLERFPGVHPGLLGRLRTEIKRFAPDIVQLNGARTVKYGVACRTLGCTSSLFVYRNIGDLRHWLRDPLRRYYYRLLLRRLDGMIALTHDNVQHLRTLANDRVPVGTIPNGVDTDALVRNQNRDEIRHARGAAAGAFVLVYVGRLSPEKRVDHAIRLLSNLVASGVEAQLWIVGEGPERHALEALTVQLGVRAVVRFEGAMPAVGPILGAADCALLLSDTEGIPAAVVEAAALGIPMIATNVGGVSGSLLDAETGFLVERGDIAGATAAALSLAGAPHLRLQLGRAARRHARRFEISSVAKSYESFYEGLMHQRLTTAAGRPMMRAVTANARDEPTEALHKVDGATAKATAAPFQCRV